MSQNWLEQYRHLFLRSVSVYANVLKGNIAFLSRVADSLPLNADPDLSFHIHAVADQTYNLNANPDPAPHRVILIEVMQICDYRSTDPTRLHFEPPSLHCARPRPSMATF
jgi:hypothetical protein